MNVREFLERRPPELLYHYTTQSGLLGIVKSKEIWATHTQYLNDVREFRHAIELVKDELSRMESDPQLRDRIELIKEMRDALQSEVESINVCVCSFSADGDVLSQWRAYATRPSGFAIGFSGAFLRAVADELKFWLAPVLYEENEQRLLVRSLLNDVLEENEKRLRPPGNEDERTHPPGGNLIAYLNRYAPILKHKSFSEEREWRIISRPLFYGHSRFDFRTGGSMLIPYFRMPLASNQRPFRIEEIVIGPAPYPAQSSRSIHGLLMKYDVGWKTIKNSQVPYRNW